MRVVDSVADLIGQTPVVRLRRVVGPEMADVYVKLESFNPGGSVKDRIVLGMIREAEERGVLKPGGTIVEPTSGNTGIGLAMVAAARGYKLIIVMPETMSIERRMLMSAYGAELILTPGNLGMKGAIEEAKRLVKEKPEYFMLQQFENPANPEAHRKTTALELLEQIESIDTFVAGVGTGGTFTGGGEILRRKLPDVRLVAVEPSASPVLSGGAPGPHKIQGIGAGFIPAVMNTELMAEVVQVSNEEAMEMSRRLAKEEGLLVGISSGAAISVALVEAAKLGPGKKVVVVAPDTGERYLSTELYTR